MQSTFNILFSAIQASVDLHHPLKTVKVKNDKEWMTGRIKKLIKARQRTFYQGSATEWNKKCAEVKGYISGGRL